MPSPFPASFASAASGNAPHNEGSANGRNSGSGDWYATLLNKPPFTSYPQDVYRIGLNISYSYRSRPRANGATATFRRPSSINTTQREGGQSSTNPPPSAGSAYVPPHMNPNYQSSFSRNSGPGSESRYSKEQLLDLFKIYEKNGTSNGHIHELFMDGWTPGAASANENGSWGKKEDQRESGTYSCWDSDGTVRPISLYEMEDEEREVMNSHDVWEHVRAC